MNIVFYFVFQISSVHAQEGMPCLYKDGTLGLNELETFNCKAVNKIVQDPKIKESYENKINDKLASLVANKIFQSLEDVTLLDQFYSHNNRDLTMKSDDVKNKCRLELMANPECGKGTDSAKIDKKLKILLNKIPGNNGENLFERLYSKTVLLRSPIMQSKLQCPVSGVGGYNLLESQLTEKAALEIIKGYEVNITSEMSQKNKDEKREQLETIFPQLKLLKNAELAGSADIVKRFQDYLNAYDSKNDQLQNHYINSFFLNEDNQSDLSKGLASQCESVSENIKNYLCKDLSHLGMTEGFAEEFFDTSANIETDLQVAKGFSCEYKKPDTGEEDIEKLSENNSVQQKFEEINNGARVPVSDAGAEDVVGPFCDLYACKAKDSQVLKSCQTGGPVTFQDLESTYCQQYTLSTCTAEVQKAISFLKTLNDTQNIIESNLSLASDSKTFGPGETKPKKRYSSFFENFVGVKGTLKAEGRPITPMTIAQKEAEFTERKLSLSPKSSSEKSSSGNREFKQQESAQQKTQQVSPAVSSNAINYEKFMILGEAQEKVAREKLKQEIIDRANNNYIAGATNSAGISRTLPKSTTVSTTEADRNSEIEKLRSELANVADSIKGSPEQKLATIAANNSGYESAKSSYDPQKAMNQAEKDRLARYRDNLDARDAELRKREFGIRTSYARNTESETRQEAARAVAESASSKSATTGSGVVKLSNGPSTSASEGVSGSSDSTKTEKGAVAEVAKSEFVNSEKLATLGGLKDLGMEGKEFFIMRVRHNGKIYEIPVKTFTYKEKKILAPLLSEKNRELAQIVFESPLFKDYQQYQFDKQKELNTALL